MTKKDYELIAEGLKNAFYKASHDGVMLSEVQRKYVVDNISELLANDNPRFDYTKFEQACNY